MSHSKEPLSVARRARRLGVLLLVPLLPVGLATPAQADQVLTSETTFFAGTHSEDLLLSAPGAGTVDVTLTDLGWPTIGTSFSFSATSASKTLASFTGTGSLTQSTFTDSFDLASAGAFYAHLTADAPGGSSLLGNYGLYSLQITFSPVVAAVPLPPSGWLLLAGLLAGLGLLRARRSGAAAGGFLPVPQH